ncbi:hypothetical protein AOR13_1020 [Alteromonas stellipolaris LMG 21856]|nr:hypothetical protein AOR13_1020 [Alteromonas stellipolaris LMG 21856]
MEYTWGFAKGILTVNKIRQITPESGMALPLWRSQFLSNVRVFRVILNL